MGKFILGAISLDVLDKIRDEYQTFAAISSLNNFGICMHYLRSNSDTLSLLTKAGYQFDVSVYELSPPYYVGNLLEFPLHIMDSYILRNFGSRSSFNMILDKTMQIIDQVDHNNLPCLTILFHDFLLFPNVFSMG
jgi:hypothetical protein